MPGVFSIVMQPDCFFAGFQACADGLFGCTISCGGVKMKITKAKPKPTINTLTTLRTQIPPLSGWDLGGANLSKADLSGIVLSYANLREADLRGGVV